MARFLVVEDNRAHRQLFSRQLDEMGYVFDVAADGEGALRLAQDHAYDVALLDFELPDSNGIEVFEGLKQMQPSIQGVLVTAFASLDTVYPAISNGITHVVAKPVDVVELRSLLENVLREGENDLPGSATKTFPGAE